MVHDDRDTAPPRGLLERWLRFCLDTPLVVALLVLAGTAAGLLYAPFDWELPGLPRDPVPVDAIPDTGENQQIVFTEWPGRSPQDVEDQVTYPLTVALLGVAGVKEVRSNSMLGFSSIFLIFDEDHGFYEARSRLLEKLASLPAGTLPEGVRPTLGPDATALGQVFWYTLEGLDPEGRAAGGFGLDELRSIQDWTVRYALAAVDGVAEVASIGGHVSEYQVDVDPDAMRAYGVSLEQVFRAVQASNVDVGARTIEINRAEYVVRGLGFLEGVEDLEEVVVAMRDDVPITLRQIAHVGRGPALRRGALDRAGAEAVGGVVVVRHGANPMAVIERVREAIERLAPSLPVRTLDDGTTSRVSVVPFYDRTGLILETLGTLEHALVQQVLVTGIVVLLMVGHLRSALLIAGLLPLAVLLSFVGMKWFGVDANIVALSGIAIAIGTMVDMGIVMTESILVEVRSPGRTRTEAVWQGARSVAGAVVTAVATTVVGFLPVFTMEGAEGKLFKPLAWTKTFALVASILVAVTVIPPLARALFTRVGRFEPPAWLGTWTPRGLCILLALGLMVVLAGEWMPLGPERELANVLFVLLVLGGFLLAFALLLWIYEPVLRWCLAHKLLFLCLPLVIVAIGLAAWLGAGRFLSLLPESLAGSRPARALAEAFPGLDEEFLPRLDEGAFLLMPVTMPHASIGEAFDMLQEQDRRIAAIPEVETVVGKIGRVESALDPAPIGMVETVIQYLPEYRVDEDGRLLRFAHDAERGDFVRDEQGEPVPDPEGRPYRNWRPEIESPRDIWDRVAAAAELPGMTTASMLQPIETRRIMLQTGLRAPMGVKVTAQDLETLEQGALALEAALKEAPGVRPETVLADRVVGKPYLEIEIDRPAIARHGLRVRDVQDVIEVAIGGRQLTTAVEGRARYPVRVRYLRELRDQVEALERILVASPGGAQIPLGQLASLRYTPGPQSIKSEDTFLVAYVLFDRHPDRAEVEVVEAAREHLRAGLADGSLVLPDGVSYRFAGDYENQVRAAAKLRVVLPLALLTIFLILYLQFRSALTTAIVFSGVFVAWAGGFLMLWLYGQEFFLDLELFGTNLRRLFRIDEVHLSVAVWVGFLALFGIATDDGVVMGTYLRDRFLEDRPGDRTAIREAVVQAGLRRIRPCLMTTATTTLALLPVLSTTGRGAGILVPMAIPSIGGMAVVLITVFVVPTLFCLVQELSLRLRGEVIVAD